MADELIGAADGINQIYAVSYDYNPDKIEVLYNGQVLTSPEDFDVYGSPTASGLEPNEIQFIYIKPTDISVLRSLLHLVQWMECRSRSLNPHHNLQPGS
jgi:hypothetical protein